MPTRRLRPYPPLLTLVVLSAITVLAGGCGGGSSGGGSGLLGGATCSETARKQWVLNTAQEWYLFPDTLPTKVDPAAYATAEDLLNFLTAQARANGWDRNFSYLTTKAAEDSLLGAGQFIGFGFRVRTDSGPHVYILEVFENSPAAVQGVLRGDEIVAVDQGSGYQPVSTLLAGGSTISDVLGPSTAGVTRGLQLLRNGATLTVSLTKTTVTMDAVPTSYGVQVFPLAGTTGVGYVALRSYISTADTPLSNAFAQFRAQNLQYFIIDLRYNGGGLIDVARLIDDLLGGGRSTSDVEFSMLYRPSKAGQNTTTTFSPGGQSVAPVRIAFLTTDATASASELSINSMRPWVETAIVGGNTYGKPVGQLAFDLSQSCPDRLRLISFKMVNSQNQGDYYTGLASLMPGTACAATDTLDVPLGSATEGMTAAALGWLSTGACASVITGTLPGGMAKPGGAAATDRFPLPSHPSPAQWWLPGVN